MEKKTECASPKLSSTALRSKLILMRDDKKLAEYIIQEGCLTIGRREDNDIHLTGKRVSRMHARVISYSECSLLEDLNSSNGTYIGSRRIVKHTLQAGDMIKIGGYKLYYKLDLRFSSSQEENELAPQLEMREGLIDKKRVPVDVSTLDFDDLYSDSSRQNSQPADTSGFHATLNFSLEQPNQKLSLAQARKILEDTFD